MNTNDVINMYNQTESLQETALKCGIHWQKVRKILITAGLYETDLSIRINRMYLDGSPIEDIALEFKMSRTAVNSYLPYEKGLYNMDNPTENAKRIRKCRGNNEKLHEGKLI